MIPGQFVAIDNAAWQLLRPPRATTVNGWNGIPRPASLWEFVAEATGEYRSFVTNGGWPELGIERRSYLPSLVPACEGCQARDGFPCDPQCEVGIQARILRLGVPS